MCNRQSVSMCYAGCHLVELQQVADPFITWCTTHWHHVWRYCYLHRRDSLCFRWYRRHFRVFWRCTYCVLNFTETVLAVLHPRPLSPSPDHLFPHLSKLQTVLFNMQHPTFRINFLILSMSLIHRPHLGLSPSRHYPTHVGSTRSSLPLSLSITFSLFHSRLKTHLFRKSFPP